MIFSVHRKLFLALKKVQIVITSPSKNSVKFLIPHSPSLTTIWKTLMSALKITAGRWSLTIRTVLVTIKKFTKWSAWPPISRCNKDFLITLQLLLKWSVILYNRQVTQTRSMTITWNRQVGTTKRSVQLQIFKI